MTMFKLTINRRRRVVFRVSTNIPCLCVCICQRCQITIPPLALVRIMMITSQWASMQQTQTPPGKECHQYIVEYRQAIRNLWCCECINLFWLIKSLHCMHRVMTAANRCEWMRKCNFWLLWSNFIFIKWATEIRGRWGLRWVTVRGLSPPGCAQDNSPLAISLALKWAPHPPLLLNLCHI